MKRCTALVSQLSCAPPSFPYLLAHVHTVGATSLQDGVRLYLCDWGFNTESHRARGDSNPRIEVIGRDKIMGILSPSSERQEAATSSGR